MKFEPKIEFKDSQKLKDCLDKTYFELGDRGRISHKNNSSPIILTNEDPIFIVFKGWNNNLVKITNDELISGYCKFIIKEESDNIVNLVPISTYCVIEEQKYTFY